VCVGELSGTGVTFIGLPFVISFLNVGKLSKKIEWGTHTHTHTDTHTQTHTHSLVIVGK
jgi:hypothetical protein